MLIKSAWDIAKERGYEEDVAYAAAFGTLTSKVENILNFMDGCKDVEQLKTLIHKSLNDITQAHG